VFRHNSAIAPPLYTSENNARHGMTPPVAHRTQEQPRCNVQGGRMTRYSWTMALAAFLAAACTAKADFITLTSIKDNTLIQVPSVGSTQLSNGANLGIFVGRTAQDPISGPPIISDRRGLLMFDLSSIPAGAHINSVKLKLQLTTGNFNTAE